MEVDGDIEGDGCLEDGSEARVVQEKSLCRAIEQNSTESEFLNRVFEFFGGGFGVFES